MTDTSILAVQPTLPWVFVDAVKAKVAVFRLPF